MEEKPVKLVSDKNDHRANISSHANKILVVILLVLLLVATSISIFFYQQNKWLEKQIESYKNSSNNSSGEEIDATYKGWRVYNNFERGLSFKLPNDFTYPDELEPSDSNYFGTRENLSPRSVSKDDLLLETTIYTNIDNNSLSKTKKAIESTSPNEEADQPFQPIGKITKLYNLDDGAVFKEYNPDDHEATYYIAIWNRNGYVYVLKLFGYDQKFNESDKLFDLIVKSVSIKKLDEKQNIACTMDAKICPDGSSVGRVPPSCEFAACPN